ncbi:MAG: hypothetical protein O3B21_02635 [Proteobacteria bacterium]|nr:hypothetical protein [Pseudomonadota bacterium]MDA1354694.1 hypothetical protein [Pseudomonadota bacterium]
MKYTNDATGSTPLLCTSDYGHEMPLAQIADELLEFIADPAFSEETKANILCRISKEQYRLP